MMQFDERAARHTERLYQTPDVVEQRRMVLQALAVEAGERVVDIGCGPGFLSLALAEAGARVLAVDPSDSMRGMTARRCEQRDSVRVEAGEATALPSSDGAFDVVVATQVYEYVADVPAALAEDYRVLRAGGRLLVLDTDWDSIVWGASDAARMQRVLDAWGEHLADAHLPRRLPGLLRAAGFRLEHSAVVPLLNAEFQQNTYSAQMIRTIGRFVTNRQGITADEAQAWQADLLGMADRGEYFFSLNRYLFVARR